MSREFIKRINETKNLNEMHVLAEDAYRFSTLYLLSNTIIPDVTSIISKYEENIDLTSNNDIYPGDADLMDISLPKIFQLQEEIFNPQLTNIERLKKYYTILEISNILLKNYTK